ncbi:MAG: hypothetical protein NXI04_28325 [Planctomycetaceae bacterium]|nr:hypothetical protein [Planctomycetaceae bacterium]
MFLSTLLFVVLLISYWFRTQLPSVVRITGGPQGGRYAQLAAGLARELRQRLDVEVEVLSSAGSLQNIERLESGQVHLGLYQVETRRVAEQDQHAVHDKRAVQFVSNLYPELVIPVGRFNALELGEESAAGRVWSCNDRLSGDFAAATWLLQHLGRDAATFDIRSVRYMQLADELVAENVDVGILCCGVNAPILRHLLCVTRLKLKRIPAVTAFVHKHASLSPATIPAGYFQTEPMIPPDDFPTVAIQAQLLASEKTPVRLIEEVTRIVADPDFQRRFELIELYRDGRTYAMGRSEFPMHIGASHVFNPELKPLVNPDFVEGTEGLRSFVVSLVVSGWLLRRWWVQRQVRQQEHRLDRYIRNLMKMEIAQMNVDGERGGEDTIVLQKMLDDVTILRQEALGEFTAHELNEDRAVDSFISMCHALSEKISDKLTRSVLIQQAGDTTS